MNVDEEVLEAVRGWWRASLQKDGSAAGVAPDPPRSEASNLLGLGRRFEEEVAITDWDIFDPATEPLGGMMLVSYGFRIRGKRGRRDFAWTGRATHVLSKEDDRWTHLFHHGVLDSGSRLPRSATVEGDSQSGD